MNIGIDVSVLGTKYDGIGFYLIRVLDFLKDNPEGNTYYLYSNCGIEYDFSHTPFFVARNSNGEKSHIKWVLNDLKHFIKEDKIDVFWQPNYILPYKVSGCKNVVTVHDMSGFKDLKYVDLKTFLKQRLFLRKTCRLADKIITISKFSQQEICSLLRIDSKKVDVIYISLPKKYDLNNSSYEQSELLDVPLDVIETIKNKKEYYLFIGTFAPRKNDKVIIKSIIEYIKKGGTKNFIFAGQVSKKSQRLVSSIPNKYKERIVFLGYVTDRTKDYIFNNAFAMLYPSRLEGFGIPILESMQYRKPVITSFTSCLPEVAGDGAIYLKNLDSYIELCNLFFHLENMKPSEIEELLSSGAERVSFFERMNYPLNTYLVIKNVYDQE